MIKSMTKIVKGMCFVTANAWGERLCKPSEAGSIIDNWLILDEGQSKDDDEYYRCVHILYVDVFDNNGERYFVNHYDNSITSLTEINNRLNSV